MASDRKPLLAISATFTAEPIEETLSFWFRKFDLSFDIQFAPYNQVFQELIRDRSLLGGNQEGVNVLLIRPEDWQTGSLGAVPLASQVEQGTKDFIELLSDAAARSAVPSVVCLCPLSPDAAADAARSEELLASEAAIASAFKDAPTVHVVTSADLAAAYHVKEHYSPHTDQLGHVPYTPDFFTALGTMVSRRVWALRSRPYKVIALDCDGTLWKGVCGEDGPDGVQFGPPWTHLQEFMVRQYEAGMLLCLCSKNSDEDVIAVFDRRQAEMPLQRKHIVSTRVNWAPKSENLRSLAAELDLGLDSFIFVDDNPLECAEVEANCPGALALRLPPNEEKIPTFLQRVWAFDHLKVTSEDKHRTEYYRANVQRETARTGSLSMEDFLRGLQLQITIAPVEASQLERVAQLTQRTNQFNATGIRRTVSDLQRLGGQEGGSECLAIQVRDRFGDYGLVGAVIYATTSDALVVDSFLLSCRVLGRRVEHRILAELGGIAKRLRLTHVDVLFTASAKNKPARDFLESSGKQFERARDAGVSYRFPSDFAAGLGEEATGRASVVVLAEGAGT